MYILKTLLFSFLLFSPLFTTGCATKKTLTVKILEPAKVKTLDYKKHIAVTHFKNDTVGLAAKVESNLAKATLNGKRYFVVVNRRQIDKVLTELELQSTDLIDPATAAKIGKIAGVDALVTGEITSTSGMMRTYLQNKKECIRYYKDGSGCARWHFYKERCITSTAALSAHLSVIDVQSAVVLYADDYDKSYIADSCKTDSELLPINQALSKLAETIAEKFTLNLVPHYRYIDVPLLDELDLKQISDSQKERFKNALEYITAGRLKKAEKILRQLLEELGNRSTVVAYDLGVVKEALGELEEAKKLYLLADENTARPLDEINSAIVRIEEEIRKKEEADRQLHH